jgi:hypothetical protein
MAALRSSLVLVVMLLVAPATSVAQQAGQTAVPSTFSTISLMVLAAGLGAMAVSLTRSRVRSRARTTAQTAEPHVASAAATAPERAYRRAPERLVAPAPELEPIVVVVEPEAVAAEPEPVAIEPLVVAVGPEPVAAEPEPEPEPVSESSAEPIAEPVSEPAEETLNAAEELGRHACRILVWSGYVKQRFYAEAASGEWIAQSRLFRLEKGRTLADSPQAAAALEALMQEVAAAGWDVTPVQ